MTLFTFLNHKINRYLAFFKGFGKVDAGRPSMPFGYGFKGLPGNLLIEDHSGPDEESGDIRKRLFIDPLSEIGVTLKVSCLNHQG